MKDEGLRARESGAEVTWLGCLSLVFYAVHAGYHVFDGHPENGLWMCHVAAVLVGVGLIVRSAALNAVGVLCLLVGLPLWIFDLVGGDRFLPTSLLTHVGALAIGLVGIRRLGVPRQVWAKAAAFVGAMHLVARWITPERANVNLAFAVWPGWEPYFASHVVYAWTMLATCAFWFYVGEVGLRYVLGQRHADAAGAGSDVAMSQDADSECERG